MAKSRKVSTPETARGAGKASRKSARPRGAPSPTTNVAEPAAPEASLPGPAARPSKKATVLALLQRREGAAIGELTAATGWQAHSVRAVLTGFRKEGKELVRTKDVTGVTHYRLAAEA